MEQALIPLSVPNFQGNESKYVMDAVNAGWVSTGGGYVGRFEKAAADYCRAPGAVACQNGTAGLHISLLLMGVGRGDAVLVPALTFIAAVNPVAYIGAEPVFMDCDDSLCMDPDKLEAYCREECRMEGGRLVEKAGGRPVKAMVVVHVFGNMADMERILDVARRFGIRVVEDATEALGTRYTEGPLAGKYAGTLGDIGVFSFNGNKIITTGGGGMIVSNDMELLRRAKHLTTQAKTDELYYIHDEVGYNYRMTNLQAALGVAQMERLPDFIAIKGRRYAFYRAGVEKLPGLRLLPFRSGTRSNHWFYALYIEDAYPLDRDALIRRLAEHRIQSRPVWGLVCDQKPYAGKTAYRVERARDTVARVVNLPCSTGLTEEEARRVLACLKG